MDTSTSQLVMLPNNALAELRRTKGLLGQPGIAIQIVNLAGVPLESLLKHSIPASARRKIDSVTQKALDAACKVAVRSMKRDGSFSKPHTALHKLTVAVTGAAGGFFGMASAPFELPLTTTVMLRSIMDIARSHGEHIDSPEARVACLEVLAFGGTSKKDDAADTSYFAIRTALAQQVSAAVNHLATKGLNDRGTPTLVTLMSRIATYFAIPVSEKLAAEAVPIIGAITGSSINTIFIGHFQRMAEGHFTVRALERKYGESVVQKTYSAL
jgi:hypothetical protein